VNQFYKGKEKEYIDRSESLRKQMDILLELKAALKQQQPRGRGNLGTDDPSISCSIISGESFNYSFSTKKRERKRFLSIVTKLYERSKCLVSGKGTYIVDKNFVCI
jgi:SPX domain